MRGQRLTACGVVIGTGLTLSGPEVRQLACDAEIHRIITVGRSIILDMGTLTRTATDSQWLALAARDGGCRWPGCDRPPQWCEAHHIDEVFRDDGPTDLLNLVLFCSCHHSLIHGQRWQLLGNAHDLTIRSSEGLVLMAPACGRHALQFDLAS